MLWYPNLQQKPVQENKTDCYSLISAPKSIVWESNVKKITQMKDLSGHTVDHRVDPKWNLLEVKPAGL